jgi:hypothetical protein
MITAKEVAEKLNGCNYRDEDSHFNEKELEEAGIIVLFGASDDLLEVRGAIHDEWGAPGKVMLIHTPAHGWDLRGEGYIDEHEDILKYLGCYDYATKYYIEPQRDVPVPFKGGLVDASWNINAVLPPETEYYLFDVLDEEDLYCKGMVIKLPSSTISLTEVADLYAKNSDCIWGEDEDILAKGFNDGAQWAIENIGKTFF